jgi:hypothetical protein
MFELITKVEEASKGSFTIKNTLLDISFSGDMFTYNNVSYSYGMQKFLQDITCLSELDAIYVAGCLESWCLLLTQQIEKEF